MTLYARAMKAGSTPLIALEERLYRQGDQGDQDSRNRQFVVVDPDGYLLRSFTDLGMRPAPGD